MLTENCHQGAYAPGELQWQGYIGNASSNVAPANGYTHFLGMFFGMGEAVALANVTFGECKAQCDARSNCTGFCFTGRDPTPSSLIEMCYLQANAHPNHMDMSNSNFCTGDADPSNCPYNLYRVSGDICNHWSCVLANLEYTLPFLGEGGVHLPYPQDATVRSRPGGDCHLPG